MSSPSGFKPNGGPSALATCLSFLFFFSICAIWCQMAFNYLKKNKNYITSPTPRVVTCASHCPPTPPPTSFPVAF